MALARQANMVAAESPERAVAMAARALELADDSMCPTDPGQVEVHVLVALVRLQSGEDTSTLLEGCLAAAEELPPGHDRDAALVTALGGLGILHRVRGRLSEAESTQLQALRSSERVYGPQALGVADLLNDIGMTYKYVGRFSDAEASYRRAMDILQGIRPDHPDLASLLHNLAGVAHARGDFLAAEPLARQGLSQRAYVHGPDHPSVLEDQIALAAIVDGLGRPKEAAAMLETAIPRLERSLGPHHPQIGAALNNLAAIRARLGDLDAAVRLYERALDSKERNLGPASPALAISSCSRVHSTSWKGLWTRSTPT
jgi:tetratricopeptide (TPR) repeat protein